MASVVQHYAAHLAAFYDWLCGGWEAASARNAELLARLAPAPHPGAAALDLGAGSGHQSIPLARMGYDVTAVDACAELLAVLEEHRDGLPVRAVQADILGHVEQETGAFDLILCMGDTLTHLPDQGAAQALLARSARLLRPGGSLLLSFRDYVTGPLQGASRFIPVRADDTRIATCFLEYGETHVQVHDLLHEKEDGQWCFSVSAYPKCRLAPAWVREELLRQELAEIQEESARGMLVLRARKPLA
jgi:2-polyprenyl-3-methyl-5-hydroxy-6-metoxy-1,4-benzoquinol methylase